MGVYEPWASSEAARRTRVAAPGKGYSATDESARCLSYDSSVAQWDRQAGRGAKAEMVQRFVVGELSARPRTLSSMQFGAMAPSASPWLRPAVQQEASGSGPTIVLPVTRPAVRPEPKPPDDSAALASMQLRHR